MEAVSRPGFVYLLILCAFLLVEGVTEEDEGVKYANKCEGNLI